MTFFALLLRRWWPRETRLAQDQDLVEQDAETLIQGFGEGAYEGARTRARDEHLGRFIDASRPQGHWDKVRQEIGRRTGRTSLDTATKYLER